jgi:hypothetical protein
MPTRKGLGRAKVASFHEVNRTTNAPIMAAEAWPDRRHSADPATARQFRILKQPALAISSFADQLGVS